MEQSEEDVNVIYLGDEWTLTVTWSATVGNDDEFAIIGATKWFEETYGWNPGHFAMEVSVEKIN